MKGVLFLVLAFFAVPLWAGDMNVDLAGIQQRWADIQYRMPEAQREKAFEDLAEAAESLADHYPDRAEPLIWQGIVLSTYAGAKGGLAALGLVKDAREALEAALAIDAEALEGSAYTSLGSLYYQVPGWPLSFGDDDKAREFLQRALSINPNGIDPNFFFGDFLRQQGQSEQARLYFNKVLHAPARPGRELADTGRREQTRRLMEQL